MYLHYLWKHEPPEVVSFQSCMVFAETTHVVGSKWNFAWCWSSGDSYAVRISSKSVKRFRSCGKSNFVLSHWFHQTNGNTARLMRKGKFWPPTSPKPINRVWRNSNLRTISWRPATVQNFISIRRREWSQRIPSMTDKTQFRVHVSPGSAKTLVRRGGITNHYSIAYSQQHLCQKLPKSVDVSTKKRPPKHFLKSSKLANFAWLQFNSMNMCLFSIKMPILVKICPTVIEILTFNKWSLKFTVYRRVFFAYGPWS